MDYFDEEARATDMDRNAPTYDTQHVTSPYHTDMTMIDAGYSQGPSSVLDMGNFMRPGQGEETYLSSTQGPVSWRFSWSPRELVCASNNAHISGLLTLPVTVDTVDIGNLKADVDSSIPHPRFDVDPTYPRSSNLDRLLPEQSVDETCPFDHGLDAHTVGSNYLVLPFRGIPQSSPVPPAKYQQDGRAEQLSAAETTSALTAPTDAFSNQVMHHGGQQRLDASAQPSEIDFHRTTPFECMICGNIFRDLPGLKYERPRGKFACSTTDSYSRKHCVTHTDRVHKYPCTVPGCKRAFRYPKDLAKHLRTHNKSSIIPFKCDVEGCDKVYLRRDRVLRHMREKHPESIKTSEILIAAASKLPRLSQRSSSSGKAPKKPRKSVSKIGSVKRSSKSKGTQSVVSQQPSAGPAMQYQEPLPAFQPSEIDFDMLDSTSYSPSLFTTDAAESEFTFDDPTFSPGPGSTLSAPRE